MLAAGPGTLTLAVILAGVLAVGGYVLHVRRSNRLKQERDLQAAFARQRIEAEDLERKRFAHELDQALGQHLLLVKNAALSGLNQPGSNSARREQLEKISTLTSQALETAHELTRRLHPFEVDFLRFDQAVAAMTNRFSTPAGSRIVTDLDDLEDILPAGQRVHLYRHLEAGLENVLQHARASTVRLEIKREPRQLAIQWEDDGVGFALEKLDQTPRPAWGLKGMEARAQLIGGQFEIVSAPDQGTRIRVSIPLPGVLRR